MNGKMEQHQGQGCENLNQQKMIMNEITSTTILQQQQQFVLRRKLWKLYLTFMQKSRAKVKRKTISKFNLIKAVLHQIILTS